MRLIQSVNNILGNKDVLQVLSRGSKSCGFFDTTDKIDTVGYCDSIGKQGLRYIAGRIIREIDD